MSWRQYEAILTEAAAYMEQERLNPPVACPFDGEPLRPSPRGGLFCLLGDYDWPLQRRLI